MTERTIVSIIKKHAAFSFFLAVIPVLFLFTISYFSESNDALIILVVPIATLAACIYFVKNVLIDIHVDNKN